MNKIQRRERRNKKMESDLVIVSHGLIYAEMNEFFSKMLVNDGYAGMSYKPFVCPCEITLRVAHPAGLLENNKLRIKQLTAMLEMRFKLQLGTVHILIEQVRNKTLNAQIQADMIKQKLSAAMPVRRVVSSALRTMIEGGAEGAQVIVSGKLKGQRAKSYKVSAGILMHSGHATNDYVRKAQSTVLLKQGVLGVKVTITLKHDPTGINGSKTIHPNKVVIYSPEEMEAMNAPAQPQKTAIKGYQARK
ncbi:small subunit ribosomal protein S3e [Nematocida sp. AWRm80]|nr:small subunit ribosomal protein S3e [Nematocida sp. AWRm80]